MNLGGTGSRKSGVRYLIPSLEWELGLWRDGVSLVAGIDEVGRGPLAGPLLAAAVILPCQASEEWYFRVRDSKVLTASRREDLNELIRRDALAYGIGMVAAAQVDRLGVVRATFRAMRQALFRLGTKPDHLLIDALKIPRMSISQTPLIHGDGRCISIACASIIAKVARDRLMERLDCRYPGYGFQANKGYGTAEHLDALRRLGPCAIHRLSFAPVRSLAVGVPAGELYAG